MGNKFRKKFFVICVIVVMLSVITAVILKALISIKYAREGPIIKCQETLKGLQSALGRFYIEYGHYPVSKSDEFFRELYNGKYSTCIALCPAKTGDISYLEQLEAIKNRVDYETWPEGFPPEKILTSPPDGYPILWDKKGNHKEGRNILILSKKESGSNPIYGPLGKYCSDVIFLNENEFGKYLNKYRLR